MRNAAAAALVLLTACATVPVEPPAHGGGSGRVCRLGDSARYIGQPATQESGDAILRATNSAVLRWARPGMMLTMEFREDRVTVRTGPDGRILAVNCG